MGFFRKFSPQDQRRHVSQRPGPHRCCGCPGRLAVAAESASFPGLMEPPGGEPHHVWLPNSRNHGWLVGAFNPSEKYESQLGWVFPIYGEIKNIPNHQPDDNRMGASWVMGDPKNGWFRVVRENPNLKWMIWGVAPFMEPPILLVGGWATPLKIFVSRDD